MVIYYFGYLILLSIIIVCSITSPEINNLVAYNAESANSKAFYWSQWEILTGNIHYFFKVKTKMGIFVRVF